jgi:hypothetical protein
VSFSDQQCPFRGCCLFGEGGKAATVAVGRAYSSATDTIHSVCPAKCACVSRVRFVMGSNCSNLEFVCEIHRKSLCLALIHCNMYCTCTSCFSCVVFTTKAITLIGWPVGQAIATLIPRERKMWRHPWRLNFRHSSLSVTFMMMACKAVERNTRAYARRMYMMGALMCKKTRLKGVPLCQL